VDYSATTPFILDESPNELRIDVADGASAEAQFNVPPHQSELN
jgi:hypothetical protein